MFLEKLKKICLFEKAVNHNYRPKQVITDCLLMILSPIITNYIYQQKLYINAL